MRDLAYTAFNQVMKQQSVITTIPMMFSENIRSLWMNQYMLMNITDKVQVEKLATTSMFRAAYDFLVLRARFEPSLSLYVDFWLPYYEESSRQAKLLREERNNKIKRKKDKRSHKINPAMAEFSKEKSAEVNDRLAKARAWRAAMNLDP